MKQYLKVRSDLYLSASETEHRTSCLFHYLNLGIKFVSLESKLIWFIVSLLEIF